MFQKILHNKIYGNAPLVNKKSGNFINENVNIFYALYVFQHFSCLTNSEQNLCSRTFSVTKFIRKSGNFINENVIILHALYDFQRF